MNPQKFTWKSYLGFFLGFVVYYLLQNFFNIPFQGVDNQKLYDKDWVTTTYGNSGIILSTPEKLQSFNLGIPPDYADLIDKMESFKFNNGEKLTIIANIVNYSSKVGEGNLKGAAEGSINELKNKEGITDLVFTDRPIQINNVEGINQSGSCKLKGIDFIFTNIILARKNILWQITILVKSNDITGEKIKDKIIKSIKFENSVNN